MKRGAVIAAIGDRRPLAPALHRRQGRSRRCAISERRGQEGTKWDIIRIEMPGTAGLRMIAGFLISP